MIQSTPFFASASVGVSRLAANNLAALAVEYHALDRSRVALIWENATGMRQTLTFHEINRQASRIAHTLSEFGVKRGDCVFTLLGRTPVLYATLPGVLKTGAALAVLFTDFGPEAIRQRLSDAHARIIVADAAHCRKLLPILPHLASVTDVFVSGGVPSDFQPPTSVTVHDFDALTRTAAAHFVSAPVASNDTCFVIYTSGTTGLPKGVVHCHGIGERLEATARDVLCLTREDLFWCTADPGWVTGLCYAIFAPWLLGLPCFAYDGDLAADRWATLMESHQITCLYTTPTLLRQLRKTDARTLRRNELALQRIYSVGEPLNAEVVEWARETFGVPVYDTYWQTETGAHVIANRPGLPVKPGRMGRPVDGVEAAIVDDFGREIGSGEIGSIAIRPTLNSLFKGYWNFPEATQKCFRNGWYMTRDRGLRDADGYFQFVAREDDVITCAAQRIGPFEVESALLQHPAVLESAVVGVPDELTTERIKAFVVPLSEFAPSHRLAEDIAACVRRELSPLACPREIEFCDELPKTRSGKIQRARLRQVRQLDADRVFTVDFT
jgi:acetyl-CoA synthetase